MNRVMELLRRLDFQCCGVYLIDASFTLDSAKLMSGMLAALSAMIKLEVAHINVLSKCDLVVGFCEVVRWSRKEQRAQFDTALIK